MCRSRWWARLRFAPYSTNMRLRSRDAMRPRFDSNFTLLDRRGHREDRVRAAPAVSCATCTKKNAHEHTGSAETLRPSLRNGFTAYSALLCPEILAEYANGRLSQNRPSLDLSPFVLEGRRACRGAWDRSGVFL